MAGVVEDRAGRERKADTGPDRTSRTTGMTLIEVLIAMVICTVALLVGSTLILASHTATEKSDLYNIANKAADDAIAGYEANGYSALTNGSSTSGIASLPGVTMTMSTTIGAPSFNSSAANIKEIDIVVTWNCGSSGSANLAGQVKESTLISAP